MLSSSIEIIISAPYFIASSIYHRGFPYSLRNKDINYSVTPTIKSKIGIAAGMWFGDPDIDTMERITNNPIIHQFSEILHEGIILKNDHFSPIDSQNTAYIRELAPLMMVLVGVGRYDDIWASFIAERIIKTTDYCCQFEITSLLSLTVKSLSHLVCFRPAC